MRVREAVVGGVAAFFVVAIAPQVAGAAEDAELQALIEKLQERVAELEDRLEAQETTSADIQRLEGEIVTLREDSAGWQDVDVLSGSDFNISGYVETSYNYNFNNPRGMPGRNGTNAGRIFDVNDNTFELNAVKLELENTADEIGDAGFRVDLLWGTQGDLIGQGGARGSASTSTSTVVPAGPAIVLTDTETDTEYDFEVEQAYVNYIADVGNGLELKAGRFVTWIGYEVIESHLNPNYSRAFTFGYSIPFIHTGVGASYAFNDMVSYSHYLVNGWDNAIDDNDDKSTGGQLVLTPSADNTFGIPLEFYFNYIWGHEGTGAGREERFVLDWIVSAELTDQLGAAINIDYGESEFRSSSPIDDDEWFGIAGYLTYQYTNALWFALRGEYWTEDNGTRSGLFTAGQDLDLWELTFTTNYQLTDNLLVRGELRYDDASEDVFFGDDPGDFEDNQFTIGGAATYVF